MKNQKRSVVRGRGIIFNRRPVKKRRYKSAVHLYGEIFIKIGIENALKSFDIYLR
jgi:hypothetical protein